MTEMTTIPKAELEALRQRVAALPRNASSLDREFNRALLESMTDGVVACDADGLLTLFNRAAREWHGADPMTLPPDEWASHYDLFREDGFTPLPPSEVPLARAFRGETVVDAGMAIAARGRPVRFVLANGSEILDAEGRKLGAVVIMRDVTELRRVETELRRANETLEARVVERTTQLHQQHLTLRGIIDGAAAPIFSVDRSCRYTAFNDRHAEVMAALYGAKIEIGRSLLDYMTVAEDRVSARRHLDRALAGETLIREAFSGDDVHSRQYFHVAHSPIRSGTGEVVGVAVLAQDLTERRRAEEALRQSEQRYRDVFDNVLDSLYLLEVTPDGRFRNVEINPAFVKSTGIPRELLLGKCVEETVPEETARLANAKYRKCIEAGRPHEEEVALDLPTGRRTFHSTLIPARDADGRITRIVGISRDVTEQRSHEAIDAARLHLLQFAVTHSLDELLEETLNQAEAISGSLIGFYHFVDDDERSLTLQNWSTRTKDRFCKAAGKGSHYSVAEAGVWVDCVHQRRPVIHNDYAALPHRKGMPEGHAQVVRELVVPVLRGEKVKAILGVGNKAVDYTTEDVETMSLLADLAWEVAERKRAETELARVNRALRMLSDSNQVLIRTTDEADLLEEVCRIVVSIGGYGMAWVGYAEHDDKRTVRHMAQAGSEPGYGEVAGVCWAEGEADTSTCGEAIRSGAACILRNLVAAPSSAPWRLEALRRGYHAAAALPLVIEGRTLGALGIYATEPDAFDPDEVAILSELAGDLAFGINALRIRSRRDQTENQLRHAQKMEAIGTLAGGVAHDFNNLLTGIIGYTNLIQLQLEPTDPLQQSLHEIMAAADRAEQLTSGLLAFSRKQILNPKPIELNDVVRNLEKLLRRLIGEDVELSTTHSASELIVMADVGQLEQVLMNLATNARDAMPDGGRLSISTRVRQIDGAEVGTPGRCKPGRYALIEVTDTGIGMDEQTREKVFEPFFTTKALGKGTGLGLAIVHGIVEQHGGVIDVQSELGRGATFSILLPLIASAVTEEGSSAPAPPATGTETILLAEDDPTVRNLIVAVLKGYGYRVIPAVDGADALEKWATCRAEIDLLLLDVIMPKKSGREVYDTVRADRPEVCVLFISGYTADIIHGKGILDEALHFIAKPLYPFELLRRVRELLDESEPAAPSRP